MSQTPFMQFYVADYLADTRHLSTEEHGAYLLLLMTMWKAGGSLPNDARKLARIAGVHPPKWARIWTSLAEFFDVEGDEITQGRLVREFEKARLKSLSRASAGSKGGVAKALKSKEPPVAIATAMLKHSSELESDIEEREEAIASLSTAVDVPSFPQFWSSWPFAKVQRAKAEAAFKRLSAEHKRLATDRAKAWGEAWRKKYPQASDAHPTTYLNGKRWEDEFVPAQQSSDPIDIRRALADRIRSGKPWNVRDISLAQARELIAAGLVTDEDCRKAGVI